MLLVTVRCCMLCSRPPVLASFGLFTPIDLVPPGKRKRGPASPYHQEWPRSRSTSGLIIGTFQSSVTQEHDNQTLLYDGAPSGVEREPSF